MMHLRHCLSLVLLMMPLCAAADEAVEPVATGFRFTEGPAVAPDGSVYFTDIPRNLVLHYDPATGQTVTVREASGGANGLMFDPAGRLLACEGKARQLTRTEADGSITVLASHYDGKRLNSPNDLVLDREGGIYFTDPRYGKRQDMELDVEAVFYLPAEGGELRQIIADLVRPNGIMLSPDGTTLYVADHGAKKIFAYPVAGPGQLGEAQLFADTADAGGCDGMSIDPAGNLYTTLDDGVHVFSPAGERLRVIATPERPANVTVHDGLLWITARTSLYRGR